jgi:DNA-binding XRE family transcriptional regulator
VGQGEYQDEIWKDIETIPYHQPAWPFHQVSNYGRVRVLPGRPASRYYRISKEIQIKKQKTNSNGYLCVWRQENGRTHYFSTHILVLNQFVGPCPSGQECCHCNGVKTDNRLENLEWKTHRENIEDKVRHGTNLNGERNHQSKLTVSQVLEIKNRSSESQRKLAKEYGVSKTVIGLIHAGKTWKYLDKSEVIATGGKQS